MRDRAADQFEVDPFWRIEPYGFYRRGLQPTPKRSVVGSQDHVGPSLDDPQLLLNGPWHPFAVRCLDHLEHAGAGSVDKDLERPQRTRSSTDSEVKRCRPGD